MMEMERMNKNEMMITVDEYKEFLEFKIRFQILQEYISKSKYSVTQDEVARILDFEIEVKK